MRFHVVSLPHTSTTKAYSMCAYTEKVRKFAEMMWAQGHQVFLYGGPENSANCTDMIHCISKAKQKKYGFDGPEDYLKIDFNSSEPWGYFNSHVVEEIEKRIEPEDFICIITGTPALSIKNAFPNNITVEFGVGYSGIINPGFRVFESYAWRNFVYGKYDMDGAFYDEVIPNYFEVEDFPYSKDKDDYFLFVGRLNANKGLNIAQDVCERLGYTLKVAGPGQFSGYGEYVGVVGPEIRGALMSKARGLFVPTLYVPPFEGVHIEAMLCGTPVITTDFGVFSETVIQGVNGFRCKSLEDFMDAAKQVDYLDPAWIRQKAVKTYSTKVVAALYTAYFERLLTLYADGWYSLDKSVLNQKEDSFR